MRGLGLILHVQVSEIRGLLRPVYMRFVDIHWTKEAYFGWLEKVFCVCVAHN